MTNKQFRNRFLLSKTKECCDVAAMYIWAGEKAAAIEHLNRALAFARQLPPNQKYIAMRAYIATAIQALRS